MGFTWTNSFVSSEDGANASGGTTSTYDYFRVHTFSSSGTFTVSTAGYFDILLVGAGGSGGSRTYADGNGGGGGGGAGGLVYQYDNVYMSAGDYTVTVGSIGSGTASSIVGDSINYSAAAGGNGRNGGSIGIDWDGGNGGSNAWYSGGLGGKFNSVDGGTGGGGAGAAGNGESGSNYGDVPGGPGVYSSITGTNEYYAYGGTGGQGYNPGSAHNGTPGAPGYVIIRYCIKKGNTITAAAMQEIRENADSLHNTNNYCSTYYSSVNSSYKSSVNITYYNGT